MPVTDILCSAADGIHRCKLPHGHSGQHYCSNLCEPDWGRDVYIEGTYLISVTVRTPDGVLHSNQKIVSYPDHVPDYVTMMGRDFESVLP